MSAPEVTYTFGPAYLLRETGVFTPETWKDRWRRAIVDSLGWYIRLKVVAIDREAGKITLA